MSIPCGNGMWNGYRSSKPVPRRMRWLMGPFAVVVVLGGVCVLIVAALTGFLPKNGERK